LGFVKEIESTSKSNPLHSSGCSRREFLESINEQDTGQPTSNISLKLNCNAQFETFFSASKKNKFLSNFSLSITQEEFDILLSIKKEEFELPLNKSSYLLLKLIGPYFNKSSLLPPSVELPPARAASSFDDAIAAGGCYNPNLPCGPTAHGKLGVLHPAQQGGCQKYLEITELAGVYILTNKLTGEQYVGSSTNLVTRIRQYFIPSTLINGKRLIIQSLNKYGIENFSLAVYKIDPNLFKTKIEPLNYARALEQYYIFTQNSVLNTIKVVNSNFAKAKSRPGTHARRCSR
jgi:GIY-YIG catalytic domain-containing protein